MSLYTAVLASPNKNEVRCLLPQKAKLMRQVLVQKVRGFFINLIRVVVFVANIFSDSSLPLHFFCAVFFFNIYLFLEKGDSREREGEKTSMCGCLSRTRYWGPGLQPRHVP